MRRVGTQKRKYHLLYITLEMANKEAMTLIELTKSDMTTLTLQMMMSMKMQWTTTISIIMSLILKQKLTILSQGKQ